MGTPLGADSDEHYVVESIERRATSQLSYHVALSLEGLGPEQTSGQTDTLMKRQDDMISRHLLDTAP
jgi:hypothetical protein